MFPILGSKAVSVMGPYSVSECGGAPALESAFFRFQGLMAETTVTDLDGFSVTSNHADEAEIRAAFAQEEPPAEPTPTEPPPPEPEEGIAATPPKIDRRTKEGRALSIQQRIDADVARGHEAKRAADAEEARLATLRAELARASSPAKGAAVPEPSPVAAASAVPDINDADVERFLKMPGAPDIEKYQSIPQYNFAVAMFVANKVAEERFEQLTQRNEHAKMARERGAVFQARVAEETAKDATFAEKLKSTPVDTRVIPFLHQHPQGQDIMVYLVQNPDVAQAITSLHPIDQIGRMGEIAGTIKARAEAAASGPARTPPISNAKPPIKPLGSSPTVSDDVDTESESFEAHFKRENARDAKKRATGGRNAI